MSHWVRIGAALFACLAAAVVLMIFVGRWAGERALQDAAAQARGKETLSVALLRNNLDKFRAVPLVLASDADIRDALRGPSASRLQALDEKFFALSQDVGAAVIYLLDAQGLTLAASNWRGPDSFVGNDYQFRPYYRDAVRVGQAEHFALGATSHVAGLYLSRRIADMHGRLLGVVVLKVDFHDLEADWRASMAPVFVTDANGVVLLGNVPGWRFRVLAPIPDDKARRLRESLQFGDATFDLLPLRPVPAADSGDQVVTLVDAVLGEPAKTRLLHTAQPVGGTLGWRLHMLSPVKDTVDRAITNARLASLLGLGLLYVAGGIVLYRRQRLKARGIEQLRARAELAEQVRVRTAQLNQANEQLRTEMDERQRAQTQMLALHDELAQAARLAVLGQVAAGVAHEINQPVAAIRTYADSAVELLRRADAAAVGANLATIARLTDRIGHITGELRAFSRKGGAQPRVISLQDALEGALLLVGDRLRRQGVGLTLRQSAGSDMREDGAQGAAPTLVLSPPLYVVADRIRLEQVLVNLLQNALDALEGLPDARIEIGVHDADRRVRVSVRDNGPGIPDAVLAQLFMPFQTTKADGLGLGLVISRDILTGFDGELSAQNVMAPSPGERGGALFTITLNQADAAPARAANAAH